MNKIWFVYNPQYRDNKIATLFLNFREIWCFRCVKYIIHTNLLYVNIEVRNAAIFNYFFKRKFAGEIQSFVIAKTFIY